MLRENLISTCSHYTGTETDRPSGGDALICWVAEEAWVYRSLEEHGNDVFGLEQYFSAGLRKFSDMDGIPMSYKALLFSFICKLNERIDADAFKEFYNANYK